VNDVSGPPLGMIPPIVAATDGIPQPAERLHDRNPSPGEISCASPLDSNMLGMTSRCAYSQIKRPETRVLVCFGETDLGPRSCFSIKYCWRGPPR
jgi:hypothetical protein